MLSKLKSLSNTSIVVGFTPPNKSSKFTFSTFLVIIEASSTLGIEYFCLGKIFSFNFVEYVIL